MGTRDADHLMRAPMLRVSLQGKKAWSETNQDEEKATHRGDLRPYRVERDHDSERDDDYAQAIGNRISPIRFVPLLIRGNTWPSLFICSRYSGAGW